MIKTNHKIEIICEEIKTLISWAEADYEGSIENEATEQAEDDLLRVKLLKEALERVSAVTKD